MSAGAYSPLLKSAVWPGNWAGAFAFNCRLMVPSSTTDAGAAACHVHLVPVLQAIASPGALSRLTPSSLQAGKTWNFSVFGVRYGWMPKELCALRQAGGC